MSSLQRRFGLPTDLTPSVCHSVLLLVHLVSFIRAMCPSHFHYVLVTYWTMSVTLILCLMVVLPHHQAARRSARLYLSTNMTHTALHHQAARRLARLYLSTNMTHTALHHQAARRPARLYLSTNITHTALHHQAACTPEDPLRVHTDVLHTLGVIVYLPQTECAVGLT